jgi:hypothetical protein
MNEKQILLFLWKSLFISKFDERVKECANQSINKDNLHFVGVLAGGNLECPNEVIDEALLQLCWDISSNRFQEVLWH